MCDKPWGSRWSRHWTVWRFLEPDARPYPIRCSSIWVLLSHQVFFAIEPESHEFVICWGRLTWHREGTRHRVGTTIFQLRELQTHLAAQWENMLTTRVMSCGFPSHPLICNQDAKQFSNSSTATASHAGADDVNREGRGSTAWADHALANLGRGATSVADLQKSAAAIVIESGGNCSQTTKSIARIGSSGRFLNNAERDLFRLLDLPIASPSIEEHIFCHFKFTGIFLWMIIFGHFPVLDSLNAFSYLRIHTLFEFLSGTSPKHLEAKGELLSYEFQWCCHMKFYIMSLPQGRSWFPEKILKIFGIIGKPTSLSI